MKITFGLEANDKQADAMLGMMIDDAVNVVKSYCHRKDIPDAAECVVRDIIYRQFKAENGDNIASIKRGDTQITYAHTIGADALSERNKAILNACRKMVVK